MSSTQPHKQSQIPPEDYAIIRDFLERSCGIVLGEHKHYLINSRLNRIVQEEGLTSLSELARRLAKGGDVRLQDRVIDAMTTNETSWFRDGYPFEILRTLILPELADKQIRGARIWSAACSSGQEPYSISIVIEEFLRTRPGALPDIQVVATDISPTVLAEAEAGRFDDMTLSRGITEEMKQRYFERDGDYWRIKASVRRRVVFKKINLKQSFAGLGRFHCIFCRNVLIYFSHEVKRDILQRLAESLYPGGYLFLGSSEAVTGHGERFETVRQPVGHVFRRLP